MNSILVIPACEEGLGGGHIFRSTALVKTLLSQGGEARLCGEPPGIMRNSLTAGSGELWITKEEAIKKRWTLIVLDRFRTGPEEVKTWAALGPVLGIDEGLSRAECDFLIDLLPGLPDWIAPNLCAPFLLPLPKKRRSSFYVANRADEKKEPLKILVSFGAEDAAGLTMETALALHNAAGNCSLTVLLGPLRKNNAAGRELLEQRGITVIEGTLPSAGNQGGLNNPSELLADYDLLVTHFGITAFEGLYARVPVLLINPGAYHEQLSQHAGFHTFVIPQGSKVDFSGLYKKCVDFSTEAARRWGLEVSQEPESLASLLLKAAPLVHRRCPLCGAPALRNSNRFPGRTYRFCSCGMICMDRLDPPPMEYNRDYFFSDYQKQYGKTYLEDFPQLQQAGEKRLRIINALLDLKRNAHKKSETGVLRLLDIGCAYGPFLAAAREQGFQVTGIDPAPEAVEYVKNSLGINAVQGFFPETLTGLHQADGGGPEQFDVITLWYVIEHFEEPGAALMAINGLLKMGGILAFSTPSAAGISRRKSLQSFLENSPADHWTIWDPRRSAAVMDRYGFRLKKRVITGHHPERFPGQPGIAGSRAGAERAGSLWFFLFLSRIFGLGDTFETYAQKVRDVENG
ncbi:MAG: methyltransferase domain-containing protein [Treponema sp.]|nr:methyltransferase domain-containing protein [Treponema sp.]